MASIDNVRRAIIDELSEREEFTAHDLVNYELQFLNNLRMRGGDGLLTTDISQYDESHWLFIYAEELFTDGDWLTVIRHEGHEDYREVIH